MVNKIGYLTIDDAPTGNVRMRIFFPTFKSIKYFLNYNLEKLSFFSPKLTKTNKFFNIKNNSKTFFFIL